MYENKRKSLINSKAFRKRVLYHILAALLLILVTITLGVAGHVFFDNMSLGTAFVASITLASGLGLSIVPNTLSGQLFASFYGILSGYVYIATSSIVIAPILHRLLHKFHLEE